MQELIFPANTRPQPVIEIAAPLARSLAADYGKQHGLARLRNKLVKALFFTIHQRLGVPAPGVMRLTDGRTVAVDCRNTAFIQLVQSMATEGAYEPEVTSLLDRLAPSLGVVYDIGANCGFLSLLIATTPGFRGRIHAFEIDPATFADLGSLVAGAGIGDRVELHDFGLSDSDGTVRLLRGKHSFLNRVAGERDSGATIDVAVHRLDGLGLSAPDLIKLDVEGHEAAVLRGAEAILRNARPLLILESWYRPGPEMMAPLEFLEALGYRLHRLERRGGDLAIVAAPTGGRAAFPMTLNLLAVPAEREELVIAACG